MSEKLEVRKDPRSEGTVADIQEQVKLQTEIRDQLNLCSDMISQLEWMRKQLYDLKDILAAVKGEKEIMGAIGDLDKKLQSVEYELFQRTLAEADTKSFRDAQKIYMKLSVLAGDVGNSVDFAPNTQQREVFAVLKERLAAQRARFDDLLNTDLPSFNRMLAEKHLGAVIVPEIQ
jgi:hypothetical protein